MKNTELYFTIRMLVFYAMIAVIVLSWSVALFCTIKQKRREKKDREIRKRRENGKK